MYYSPSTGGFYPLARRNRPADCVTITPKRHAYLVTRQAAGATIEPGPDGRPVSRLPDAPGIEAQRNAVVTLIKQHARHRIEAIAPLWRQINDCQALALAALGVTLDDAQSAEIAAIATRRALIDGIRLQSDALEARALTLDSDALAAFRETLNDDATWEATA